MPVFDSLQNVNYLRSLLFLALLFTAVVGIFGLAQAQVAVSPPSPAATLSLSSASVDPALASPREVLRTFIGAMQAVREGKSERISDAIKTLNLGDLPEIVRDSEGRDLAVKLLGIINRTRTVNFDKIPVRKDGKPYVFREDSDGFVIIDKENDQWRFSRDTIRNIPELYRAIEAQKIISGEEDENDLASLSLKIRRMVAPEYKQKSFLLENWQWLGIVVILALIYPLQAFLLFILSFIAARLRNRLGHFSISRNVIKVVRPATYFILAYVLEALVGLLDIHQSINSYFVSFFSLVRVVTGLMVVYHFLVMVVEHVFHRGDEPEKRAYHLLAPLLYRLGEVIIYIVGVVLVAKIFGINITGLMAGLGLGGLAFALAAKDTIENLFGSIMLLVDAPFSVGDLINIDGIEGTVEHIGIRSTRIRTLQHSLVSMPNSKLISSAVDNLGARKFWRLRANLLLRYRTAVPKIEAFCEGIRELIRLHELTKKEDFVVNINQLSAGGIEVFINVLIRISSETSELKVREEFFLNILRLAAYLKVRFANISQGQSENAAEESDDAFSEPNLNLKDAARHFVKTIAG